MSALSTGLSALQAFQRSLDVIGNNVANANTPGYHRQVAELLDRPPQELANLSVGTGVTVGVIDRLRSGVLEAALTQNQAESGATTASLNAMQEVETLFGTGDGSLGTLLENFFNQLEQLSTNPGDPNLRGQVLAAAQTLAGAFNATATGLSQLQTGIGTQVSQVVSDINSRAQQIAQLNESIRLSEVRGIPDNADRDRRDQLVNEVADRAGVRTIDQPDGETTVLVAGVPLVIGNQVTNLVAAAGADGTVVVTAAGTATPLDITDGQLGGLLQTADQVIPDLQGRVNLLAQTLAGQFNAIQSTGLGLGGPVQTLFGENAVSDISVPLAQAGLVPPPQAGSVFVTVTDLATGKRMLSQVAIDPQTQSLQDVAAALSAVPNLQAVADPQTKTLRVLAAPGFAFDFAGRLPSAPDTSGLTGSAVPQLGGTYTGAANDTFTFKVVGGGTVGVTPNLTLLVQDAAGQPVASLDVGQGYAPGSTLQVADGVTLQLSAGTLNAGDTFSTPAVAQPDTAGLLPALGLSSFFTGSSARDLAPQADLLADPGRLAASRTGQPGDGSNLQRMAALRDGLFLAGGTQTFGQFYAGAVGDVGSQVQHLADTQTSQQAVAQQLQAQQQAVSGVDPNEELMRMVQFQKAFQMAAKYVSVINTTIDALVQILQ